MDKECTTIGIRRRRKKKKRKRVDKFDYYDQWPSLGFFLSLLYGGWFKGS
jgi:hypothetical protein